MKPNQIRLKEGKVKSLANSDSWTPLKGSMKQLVNILIWVFLLSTWNVCASPEMMLTVSVFFKPVTLKFLPWML